MDLIHGLMNSLTLANLLYCFLGCLLGTLVGVLPGLGPSSTLSILLPITMYLNPTGSIIMLAGLCYGAMYGGSTTSILVNIPGEAASVTTAFDGFPMTKRGRGGEALWIAAVGSFIAGTLGTIALSVVGPGVAKYAFKFGPSEYFGLLFLSMTTLISLSGASIIKGLGGGLAGILIASIGLDPVTGLSRFTFGLTGMMRGLDLIPLTIGIFGIGEILVSAEAGIARIYEGKLGKMMPRGEELKKGLRASFRGTLLGFPLGLLPGLSPVVSSFLAYDLEKKLSKYPEKFGTGVIEGVAGPEAANNATAQAGFLPLMIFGIPTNPPMAIILAALMLYGLKPGPVFFVQNKEFVWTVIGSMYIGNVMLLILNLPLVGLWARISTIPYRYLAPIILAICIIGAYSPRNTMFDVWIALGAGVVGYLMRKHHWPPAPLLVGFILGPMLEISLRQSLSIGGPLIFFTRSITIGFLLAAVILLIVSVKFFKRLPKEILQEEPDA
ncbi:MAG: transporter [Deltaproteobacteria bacterium]|jgi:putative tricarboxylic transport membrane protein|nr:transporter [Deltaproteobacteria bacterium]